MRSVASNAFVWRWRDHHNPVENERAPFERGESLQEVDIHIITVPPITTLLGITHQEYAHVIHRLPVDRRLRDQIAYNLGVHWSAIASHARSCAALAGDRPSRHLLDPGPCEPWYLVHQTTGRIVSGPHNEPLPENAAYYCDPLTQNTTNLVVLFPAWTSEEAQLPPEGYSAMEDKAEDEEDEEAYDTMLDELAHTFGNVRRL